MIIIARANRRRQESIRHEIRIIMSKSQREKSMGISERGDLQSNSTQLNNSRRKPSVNRRSTIHRRYAYWTKTIVLLGEEIPSSEEPDFIKTLAAKLEVLNEQYSKQDERRRKIWRMVFAVILIVSAASLIRYLIFFTSIYQMKNIGDASASTSVTVIGGSDVPAYISIWYYLSVMKPVLISVLAAITSVVGLYRTRKN